MKRLELVVEEWVLTTWWSRDEVMEDVEDELRMVSKPLKSLGFDGDAAAARRSLCSRSVVDERLDDRGGSRK